MSDVVSLNKARKAKVKVAERARAVENRTRFGRKKGERLAADAELARASKAMDGAKLSD